MIQRHAVRGRRFGPPPSIDCGFTLRLDLAEPVSEPLSLGHGRRYGLGLSAIL